MANMGHRTGRDEMDVWMNDKKNKPMITTNLMSMTITSGFDHGDDHDDILRLNDHYFGLMTLVACPLPAVVN